MDCAAPRPAWPRRPDRTTGSPWLLGRPARSELAGLPTQWRLSRVWLEASSQTDEGWPHPSLSAAGVSGLGVRAGTSSSAITSRMATSASNGKLRDPYSRKHTCVHGISKPVIGGQRASPVDHELAHIRTISPWCRCIKVGLRSPPALPSRQARGVRGGPGPCRRGMLWASGRAIDPIVAPGRSSARSAAHELASPAG